MKLLLKAVEVKLRESECAFAKLDKRDLFISSLYQGIIEGLRETKYLIELRILEKDYEKINLNGENQQFNRRSK